VIVTALAPRSVRRGALFQSFGLRKGESVVKLRLTVTAEYPADPRHYPEAVSPEEMAAVDEDNFTGDGLIEFLCNNKFLVKVEPVEEVLS
jgi:hypothetical protein